MNISISYNGEYPNLCSGQLIVTIDNIKYDFGKHCLSSGGSVTYDGDGIFEVYTGEWIIDKWPDNFPVELKELVEEKINEEIPYGCCGGCI